MRPGRSSASSSDSGMFVAIITRIRYLGGGFGRMPSARRPQRLRMPRGFLRPDSSVSSACSVPMPPPPPPFIPPPMTNRLRRSGSGAGARRHRLAGEQRAGVLRQVGEPVAARVREGRRPHAAGPARDRPAERPAVAQRVRLVEEHDHAAVAQRELAQLPEQRLDLEDPDAHEHVDERAGVDEDVRPAGLTGDRLGHQRLAGAGRPPQQDAAGDVAALAPRSRPASPGT